jgi:hypothetical protein
MRLLLALAITLVSSNVYAAAPNMATYQIRVTYNQPKIPLPGGG